MFDINQVYKIDNFLDDSEIKGFDHFKEHYEWRFINSSYDDSKIFWKKDLWGEKLGKCKIIEKTFKQKVETFLNIKVETVELFMNGQAHGQCGSFHSDELPGFDPNSDYITLVYYANRNWLPEYGGFTLVEDKFFNLHIVYPKPNSVVIFNSRSPHVGLEPTSHCKTQRETLAHKMKILKE